jgi:hypothetical protein
MIMFRIESGTTSEAIIGEITYGIHCSKNNNSIFNQMGRIDDIVVSY